MYSQNERAKKLMGCRPDGIPLDQPSELGFKCPVGRQHHLEWSEYQGFIWCHTCNFDYPSPLCMPDLKNATEIFLDIIEDMKTKDVICMEKL